MTENEIIEALSGISYCGNVCHLSAFRLGETHCETVAQNAISLIKEKQAQIEHLTAEKTRLQNLLNDFMKDEVST